MRRQPALRQNQRLEPLGRKGHAAVPCRRGAGGLCGTGFGSALVIVPLRASHWPLPEVVTLTLLQYVPASLLLVVGGLSWH